jgi:hypothetical protein
MLFMNSVANLPLLWQGVAISDFVLVDRFNIFIYFHPATLAASQAYHAVSHHHLAPRYKSFPAHRPRITLGLAGKYPLLFLHRRDKERGEV